MGVIKYLREIVLNKVKIYVITVIIFVSLFCGCSAFDNEKEYEKDKILIIINFQNRTGNVYSLNITLFNLKHNEFSTSGGGYSVETEEHRIYYTYERSSRPKRLGLGGNATFTLYFKVPQEETPIIFRKKESEKDIEMSLKDIEWG